MKVYLSKYRNHWISPYTILEKIYFWREIDYNEPFIDRISKVLYPLCVGIQKVLDVIHPKVDYVKIDKWDTWSMDHSLSIIILPMLKQLKEIKHGAPFTRDEDVPDDLKSTAVAECVDGETDSNWFMRWDWILGEMIFAFEHIVDDAWEEQFWSGDHGTGDTVAEILNRSTRKLDKEGYDAVQKRINNGLRLFGVYYRNLWD